MSATYTRRLRQLISTHGLTDDQVATLVHRTVAYVRQLKAGKYPVTMPILRLLELELKHGRGADLRRSTNSAHA